MAAAATTGLSRLTLRGGQHKVSPDPFAKATHQPVARFVAAAEQQASPPKRSEPLSVERSFRKRATSVRDSLLMVEGQHAVLETSQLHASAFGSTALARDSSGDDANDTAGSFRRRAVSLGPTRAVREIGGVKVDTLSREASFRRRAPRREGSGRAAAAEPHAVLRGESSFRKRASSERLAAEQTHAVLGAVAAAAGESLTSPEGKRQKAPFHAS